MNRSHCETRSVEQSPDVPSHSEETAARHKPRVQVMASLVHPAIVHKVLLVISTVSGGSWSALRAPLVEETLRASSKHGRRHQNAMHNILLYLTAEVLRRVNSRTWNAWYRELQSVPGFFGLDEWHARPQVPRTRRFLEKASLSVCNA